MTTPADGRCIHQVFEERAAAVPDRVALTLGPRQLSYRELNERANRLAHLLRSLGVGPDVLVGVCLDRTLELVVALLGILKAGGSYLPVDPQYPRDRVVFMLQDAGAPVFVTQGEFAAGLALQGTRVILVDSDAEQLERQPVDNPQTDVTADDLAYVIYTSGSTGTPKGTLITHRNVVRLFTMTQPWFHFGANDVWTLFHSVAFDFSVWELWGALFHGGRLVIVPFATSRAPASFHALLRDEGVTVLNQTPSAFRQLIHVELSGHAQGPLALRYVIFGGEALDLSSLQPWFERHGDQLPQLVNMYGITETTVHVTYRPVRQTDVGAASLIGVPIPDLTVHLLDESGSPVEDGVAGEIHVGGAGVARGYLNRPELTAARFVPDPFRSDAGARLYRSGDLARRLPGGDLEYLGRIDQQVKIRGFRIELGEIVSVLNSHAGIRDSVVIAGESAAGEKILIGYLIRAEGAAPSLAEIRALLRTRLPEYMVPAGFAFIERIPLTVNGKLDVRALPPPERDAAPIPAADGRPGQGPAQQIAAIWREVLRIDAIGDDQNFFDVGGDSISLATVHERLQQAFSREIPIMTLFQHTTVGALAAHLAKPEGAGDGPSAARSRADRQREMLAAQRRSPKRSGT